MKASILLLSLFLALSSLAGIDALDRLSRTALRGAGSDANLDGTQHRELTSKSKGKGKGGSSKSKSKSKGKGKGGSSKSKSKSKGKGKGSSSKSKSKSKGKGGSSKSKSKSKGKGKGSSSKSKSKSKGKGGSSKSKSKSKGKGKGGSKKATRAGNLELMFGADRAAAIEEARAEPSVVTVGAPPPIDRSDPLAMLEALQSF